MKSLNKTVFWIVLILIISQSIFITIFTTIKIQEIDTHAKAISLTAKVSSGQVNFCINTPPVLNLSDCNTTAGEDEAYSCQVTTTDPDYYNFTYASSFIVLSRAFNDSNESLFEINSTTGNISFTPDNYDVGNYTIEITVTDGLGCANSRDLDFLVIRVENLNDPPYLAEEIPDIIFSASGQVLHMGYLDNFFADPDQDPLAYNVSLSSSDFSISIDNSSSSVVVTANACDVTGHAIFTAKDPFNETAQSNLVVIKCITPTAAPAAGTGEDAGSGSGGGSARICIPEYECYDYHKCNINNTKILRCVDTKGCEPEVFLTVECKYEEEIVCNESWECSEWEACQPNGTQSRTCIDINDCGTTENIPSLNQECEYIGTCEDGIKNCHDGSCEESVDCGGPCTPCQSIEVPYPFEEEKSILMYIISGIILFILTAVLLYHYFHKEINSALAKAAWIVSRHKKKQILLTEEDKKKLLINLLELEQKIHRFQISEILNKYAVLLRYYLTKVCGKDLTPEFNLDELKEFLKSKKKIREILRTIFVAEFSKYLNVEKDKNLITKTNMTLLIEELRNLVLQTSKVTPEDVAREIKEFDIPEKTSPVEKMTINITNIYIALEFVEVEIAKKRYLEMLADYEKLGIKEQELVFEDISRLYHSITYVNSWYIPPKA
ncbi:MAG: hypothetical protein KKF46_00110 [Nanoarchaeota archaeon]|nr:hypothetical protein [Nanoarchaeota archaeon]MBU1320737.1 hypothetical protein [Nanoarchaeota archaeon]MBU1596890.1 hypothetical protein [Nanoarchaeota archaeon]MBU2440824.1 hypothetical protein [Nanoarchaeota archaeon]